VLLGFAFAPLFLECQAPVRVRRCIVGSDPECVPEVLDRLDQVRVPIGNLSNFLVVGQSGHELEIRLQHLDRLGVPNQRRTEIIVRVGVVGVDAERGGVVLDGARREPNVADLARDVFQKASDLGLKEAALRVLSVDPKSQGLLTQLLEDKSQPKSLRALSATGLNILNPQKFADIAQKIVKDHDDYEDIRASVLGALANTPLHQAIRDHTDFLDAVRNLDTKSPLDNLRAAAHRFLTKS